MIFPFFYSGNSVLGVNAKKGSDCSCALNTAELVKFAKNHNTVKNDFYDRLAALLRRPYDEASLEELYVIMRLVCEESCPERMLCPDLFSLLEAVCASRSVPKPMADGLQRLRRKSEVGGAMDKGDFLAGASLLADFIALVSDKPVPEELQELLAPNNGAAAVGESRLPNGGEGCYPLLRVRVVSVDGTCVTARADSDELPNIIRIDCAKAGDDGCLAYVAELVHKGSMLNLLDASVTSQGECVPQWIVFDPDYLASPSRVAAVFEAHGASPYNYFLRMFAPSDLTLPLLLGNASGDFLDDLLAEAQSGGGETATYAASISKAFRKMPVDFSLLMTTPHKAAEFHAEAQRQFNNIRSLLQSQINAAGGFRLDESLLEPTLVCPQAGLAGRADFMQCDGSRLIEQKSGKRDDYWNTGREPHLVQLLLYQVMIEHSLGGGGSDMRAYLLYSRYPDGLMLQRSDKALLYRALEMRNKIVSMTERIANGELGEVMTEVTADDLRLADVNDKFWFVYAKPRIDRVLGRFAQGRKANDLAYRYAVRFCAFLMKENWYDKMGNPASGSHGYADLWNSPAMERIATGDTLAGLTIDRVLTADNRIESLVFTLPEDARCRQSNFRLGDAVQIYSYEGCQPNVSAQCTFRGKLARLTPEEAEVALSNPQHQLPLFSNAPGRHFAIEHDHIDASNAVLCRSLFAFMNMQPDEQDSFLLTRLPEQGTAAPLCADYGRFNDLVALERASREWFLVIGPPGSGKTSRALRHMVEEELRASQHSRLLLLAYTNKAVDELCGMLEKIIADTPMLLGDYLRLGHQVSASPEYHPRMLDSRVANGCGNVKAVRDLLGQTRVVVATTTTMSKQTMLLGGCDFEVAFVDEASQILEPHMLPIYTQGRIGRYVLVGDQKQLPAVVKQNRDEAAVSDETLNGLGITNCSESLFCRMLHRFVAAGRTDLYCQIRAQGRMHPDLFRFVNDRFYGGTLQCVPLDHQQRAIEDLYPVVPEQETLSASLTQRLARNRVVFLDCRPVDDGLNDKVNLAEARAVADCIAAFAEIYRANGRTLQAEDVGVIVPYRNQISMIRECLRQKGLTSLDGITIDTVERYQGSQRNIIIYSLTVRHTSQIRFLTSSAYSECDGLYEGDYTVDRKLNVALTRAREQIVVVGNKPLLEQTPLFRDMIGACCPPEPRGTL